MAAAGELTWQLRGKRACAQRFGSPDGRPCLALHGWLDNSSAFAPLAAHLPELQWVAPDLPGHGQSAHRSPDANYDTLGWVADVAQWADALAWDPFICVGHSMGAAIAMLFAATFPARVSHLILLDGFGPLSAAPETAPDRLLAQLRQEARRQRRQPRPYPSVAAMAAAAQRVVPHLDRAAALLLAQRGAAAVPGGFTWSYDPRLKNTSALAMPETQILAFLRRIEAPTLFIRPAAGLPMQAEQLRLRQAAVRRLEQVRVGLGHHAHMGDAAATAAAMGAFLAKS